MKDGAGIPGGTGRRVHINQKTTFWRRMDANSNLEQFAERLDG